MNSMDGVRQIGGFTPNIGSFRKLGKNTEKGATISTEDTFQRGKYEKDDSLKLNRFAIQSFVKGQKPSASSNTSSASIMSLIDKGDNELLPGMGLGAFPGGFMPIGALGGPIYSVNYSSGKLQVKSHPPGWLATKVLADSLNP